MKYQVESHGQVFLMFQVDEDDDLEKYEFNLSRLVIYNLYTFNMTHRVLRSSHGSLY